MKNMTREKGGPGRFDYVQPNARALYRCPATLDAAGENKGGGTRTCGMPINPNGMARTIKRHIDLYHSGVGRDIHIRVERFNKKSPNLVCACPARAPHQRRGLYGQSKTATRKVPGGPLTTTTNTQGKKADATSSADIEGEDDNGGPS